MNKKIVMLLTNPCTSDSRVLKEAKSLIDHKYKVTVLAWDRRNIYPRKETVEQIEIERIKVIGQYDKRYLSLLSFISFYFVMFFRLLKMDYDIIHCHDYDTLGIGFLVAKIKRKRVVFDAHEPDYYYYLPKFIHKLLVFFPMRFFSKRCDAIIVTNSIQQEDFRSWGLMPVIVANCPPQTFYDEYASVKPLNEPILGYIGTIREAVGVDEIVKAFPVMMRNFPKIKFLLVGPINSIYLHKKVVSFQQKYPENVQWIDSIPYSQIPDYYRKINISIMLYKPILRYKRSTAIKVFESMAMGVPIITSNVGEAIRVIKENKCGIILEEISATTICEAISELLENPIKTTKMIKRAQKAFLSKYNWEIMEQRLLNVYNSL